MKALAALPLDVRQYLLVTGNYWAFTLTDGALRMLVVLHFHALGYTPLEIAALFLFYEIFGVITNLVGGYLGARLGLNRTMNIGLALQVIALLVLTVPTAWLTVPLVMGAQAISGIAKDLNKMSAKSSIKLLVPDTEQGTLYKWVAILTGSKNALKGVGFFLGGRVAAGRGEPVLLVEEDHDGARHVATLPGAAIGVVGRRLQRRDACDGRCSRCGLDEQRDLLEEGSREGEGEAKIPRCTVQEPRDQYLVCGADVLILRARCLVRDRAAGLSQRRIWMGFLVGGRLHGQLGNRIRYRAVDCPLDHADSQRPGSGWPGGVDLGAASGWVACRYRVGP